MTEKDDGLSFCTECGLTVMETPLYRNNPKGQKAEWRCKEHLDKQPPDDVVKIMEVVK